MEGIKLVINIEIVDTVINLARKRRLYERIYTEKIFPDGRIKIGDWGKNSDSDEWKQYKDSEEKLLDYLTSLDFEAIKELQVLMYIGRDKPYKEISDGMQRFNEYFSEFNANGWKDQTIEINTLVEKNPLPEYLLEGKKILGW